MAIEEKIRKLGYELPPLPEPAAVYVPAVIVDNFIFVSGQTPKKGNKLIYTGKVGRDITLEEGKKAAEICILRCLSTIKHIIGDLDTIKKIVKVTGYVNTYDNFTEHSYVINGASELLEKLFGDKGKHSRVAVGTNSLPGDASIEIEMVVKI